MQITPQRTVRLLIPLSAGLTLLAAWRQTALPPPEQLRPEVLVEPLQTPVEEPTLRRSVGGVEYRIEPRYRYEIAGLIVSMHDANTWWDYAHKEWKDHINPVDLCVVWGKNAASGVYRSVSFHNTQWECHFQSNAAAVWQAFALDQVSNNHLVTDDPSMARALRRLAVGEQVRIRGLLVDYIIYDNGVVRGGRTTSTTRTDTGPGACEVIYVQSVETLAHPGYLWHIVGRLALVLLAASVVAWLALPAALAERD